MKAYSYEKVYMSVLHTYNFTFIFNMSALYLMCKAFAGLFLPAY